MPQLVINIENKGILASLKRVLSSLDGVSIVKTIHTSSPSRPDITQPAGYREAMEDKREGRVYHADNAEDMLKQILG